MSSEIPEMVAVIRWLGEQIRESLSQALQSTTGSETGLSVQSVCELPAGAQLLWWAQPFSSVTGVAVWIGASEQVWLDIGAKALSAPAGLKSEPGEIRSAYVRVIQQTVIAFAQALAARLRRDISCEEGSLEQLPPAGPDGADVEVSLDGSSKSVFVRFGDELKAALSAAEAAAPVEPAGSLANEPAPARSAIDLLLDVELPVSVSFGRTQLPLKDVIKLTTGSIVELNRTVVEPVEVIVNNCVIARGEVVVVDGNYGVRINQIIPRQERLRTLY